MWAMKTSLVVRVVLILCVLLSFSFGSHAANPTILGQANFDLMEMDFSERMDTLLGQTDHYRVAIPDGPAAMAYNFIVRRKQDRDIRVSLGRLDVSRYRYEFKATPGHDLIGVAISFVTSQDLRAQVVGEIDRHPGYRKVPIDPMPGYPSLYRWESKDRIIQFAFATHEKDNVYSIAIVDRRYDCPAFPLERVFVGEDICLKTYARARR
jgi:hypothetical protein